MIRKIIWIVGGLVITVAAFFIADRSGSIWPAVMISSIVGTIFIVAFAFRWVREIESSANQKAIIWVLAVMLLGSGISATVTYISSNQHYKWLVDIRTNIEKEMLASYIHKPLLRTLRTYQKSDDKNPKLDDIFYTTYDSLIQDGRLAFADFENDDSTVAFYVYKAVGDTLILAGESSVLDVESENYQNASGAQGQFEMHGILTPNGISYERRN